MNTSEVAQLLTAETPKIVWFLNLKQVELAELTQTDPAWWNRILAGAGMNEASLKKIAKSLDMEPHSLFSAISLRRQGAKLAKPKVPKRLN